MQKGKHQGGQTQGFSSRNYSTHPGNPENSRQYTRGEVPTFHASGTPGGGPMRGMHHAPPTQPPTPPTSQDLKQPQPHLQPPHQMAAPQSGGPMIQYAMTGAAGRGNNQQGPFYGGPAPRAPPGQQRMTRAPVVMSNNSQQFIPQQVVQPLYQGQIMPTQMSSQQPVFVSPQMNPQFHLQQRSQGSPAFYPTQQIIIPQQPHPMFQSYQQMYYAAPTHLQQLARPGGGGPVPSSQGAAPTQPQPTGMTVVAGPGGAMVPAAGVTQMKPQRRKNIIPVIDPVSGRDIMKDVIHNDNTPPRSGESSARQTPQPNSGQTPDPTVAAEFATKVAIAAKSDRSGSPGSFGIQQPSSRISNYSESESQASPDPQGMSSSSVSPSKIDASGESIPNENPIVENNIPYEANQVMGGWGPVLGPTGMQVELIAPMIHQGMIIRDDMMRAGPPPNQPPRDYPGVPTQWIPDANTVPVPVIIKDHQTQAEPPVRPPPVTPVVSALSGGPAVDLGPRHPREQFPALGKGHQAQSPSKRKQRSEQVQDHSESKLKEHQQPSSQHQQQQQPPPPPTQPQLPLQQQPQQQQQLLQQSQQPLLSQQSPNLPGSFLPQSKPKIVTPTVESKKQSTQPSQESDDHVQCIQTRNNEQKIILTKKNDSDSSETKTKSNDSLTNKENNNLETRNLNEEVIQENNNRNKSDVIRSEIPVPKESSPIPSQADANSAKNATEEVQDAASIAAPVTEVDASPVEDNSPSKTNGETISDDAKSNNQKSKGVNKRQSSTSQSKMRLDKKETRNVEAETPATEVAPALVPPAPETKIPPPSVVVNNDVQPEEIQAKNEPVKTEEDKEKEKEDLIVAAKNEENNKQTASMKANDTTHAPVIDTIIPKQPVLKHNYKDDQWSPFNPDGKKKYDRDFIMGLMHDPQSKKAPENLPNFLDLLKDNKQRPPDRNFINAISRSHGDSLMPNFASKNSSQRGTPGVPKRGSQQGKPKPTKPPVIHMSLSLNQDVKLREAENAWKPARVAESCSSTEEEAKTDSLYKRVRGVLNKLTPQKFSKLVDQVKSLPIDNAERLRGVIDLVFLKAVDEPSFSLAYAQMCKILQKMQVPSGDFSPDGKPLEVNFRKILIDRCQQEFEKDRAAELKRDEKLREIEEETDPEKKKILQLTFEEEERRIRMKSVGNIRFIGELYKLQMLTSKIMHRCIHHLLGEGDEESLECLCKLLTTVGQSLEKSDKSDKDSKNKDDSDQGLGEYFKRLSEIARNRGNGKVSSRVRFMIQDLIDLRNNKWVPRRDDSNPKTMDAIEREVDKEALEINLALNSPQDRNKRQDSRNLIDNRKQRGGPDSAGWMTVPAQNKQRFNIQTSKLKIDQSEMDLASNPSTLSLGNRNQFRNWTLGAGSAKMDDKVPFSQLSTNMYAVLDDKASQPASRSSSLKGTSPLTDRDKMFSSYKPGVEDDVRSSRSGSQQGTGSRSSSRDSVSSRREEKRYISPANKMPTAPVTTPAPTNNPPVVDSELLKKKAKFLLEEYLSCDDLNEATLSFQETFEHYVKGFIVEVLSEAMEKKGQQPRFAVGKLMNHFIASNLITKQQYFEGWTEMLECAEDLEIDMPLVWQYLAELLLEMCKEEVLTLREAFESLAPIRQSPGGVKLVGCLLKSLVKEKGEDWVEQRWIIAKPAINEIIQPEQLENFAKQNNLEFLLKSNSDDNLTMDTIKNELVRMISSKASFDEITAWINANVDPEKQQTPQFVRTLMTAILEISVTKTQNSYKFHEDLFNNCDQLILRYTDHKEALELPCLYAVQALMHKIEHPSGLLHQIFTHLWDNELIALETFKLWRDSDNPNEREGHGVCDKALTSFFIVLNENETDDDNES